MEQATKFGATSYTDAALVKVTELQHKLAQDAQAGMSYEYLVTRVNQIAEAEGRLSFAMWLDEQAGNGTPREHVLARLIRQLTRDPRDTWSGRGNDAARAKHDGFREAAQEWMTSGGVA